MEYVMKADPSDPLTKLAVQSRPKMISRDDGTFWVEDPPLFIRLPAAPTIDDARDMYEAMVSVAAGWVR